MNALTAERAVGDGGNLSPMLDATIFIALHILDKNVIEIKLEEEHLQHKGELFSSRYTEYRISLALDRTVAWIVTYIFSIW